MKTRTKGVTRSWTFLLAFAGLAWPGAATAQEMGPVVDVDWLARNLGADDLVLLHVQRPDAFGAGHIPGGQRIELSDLSEPTEHTDQPHMMLELAEPGVIRDRLERVGISDDSRVVVVFSDGGVTPATRVLFTLQYMGLGEQSALLNGGLEAWVAAGRPVTGDVTTPARGVLTKGAEDRIVSHEWVLENGRRPGIALLDARSGAFYDGVREDRGMRGHVPGARSVPAPSLVDEGEGGAIFLKPADELRSIFAAAGVEPGDEVVTYCHIGQFATLTLLAARVLGHDVRLYDGSMDEWAMLGLPVERAQGR